MGGGGDLHNLISALRRMEEQIIQHTVAVKTRGEAYF